MVEIRTRKNYLLRRQTCSSRVLLNSGVNTSVSTNRVLSSELWDTTLHDSAKTPLRFITIF